MQILRFFVAFQYKIGILIEIIPHQSFYALIFIRRWFIKIKEVSKTFVSQRLNVDILTFEPLKKFDSRSL